MRFILTALSIATFGIAFSQTYQEGALTLPSSGPAGATLEAKLQVWVGPTSSIAKVGSRTVLFVLDSISNPGFEIVDLQTKEAVSVTAANDAASIRRVNRLEGGLFPLLPTHAGFAATWPDFRDQVESLAADNIFSHVVLSDSKNNESTLAYDSLLPETAGKETWVYRSSAAGANMVSWSYVPPGGEGLMRSAKLGEGEIRTESQALSYGLDAGGRPPSPADFASAQQAKIEIVGGSITAVSGFLQSPGDAARWLLARTVYKLQSA